MRLGSSHCAIVVGGPFEASRFDAAEEMDPSVFRVAHGVFNERPRCGRVFFVEGTERRNLKGWRTFGRVGEDIERVVLREVGDAPSALVEIAFELDVLRGGRDVFVRTNFDEEAFEVFDLPLD